MIHCSFKMMDCKFISFPSIWPSSDASIRLLFFLLTGWNCDFSWRSKLSPSVTPLSVPINDQRSVCKSRPPGVITCAASFIRTDEPVLADAFTYTLCQPVLRLERSGCPIENPIVFLLCNKMWHECETNFKDKSVLFHSNVHGLGPDTSQQVYC